MKVLKEGKHESWGIEITCSGAGNGGKDTGACGATLLIEENDVFSTGRFDYGGGSDYYYTIECPCCKIWTDIPDKKLPQWVKDKADKDFRSPERPFKHEREI